MLSEIVPARTVLFNPPPGKRIDVELVSRRGLPFEVAVATPEGAPIQGAQLVATHWDGTAWLPLSRETTGEGGRATVYAPMGELLIEVQKPGFTSRTIQESELAIVPQNAPPLRVILRPSGVVSGLVMAFGKFFLLPVLGATLFGWLSYALKTLHNFAGPLFAVSLLIVFRPSCATTCRRRTTAPGCARAAAC